MKTLQALFVLFFGIFFQTSNGQFTDEINSNRPGKSMMAFAVGKSIFQTEMGVNYVSENHNLLNYKTKGFISELAIRYGAFKEELEFIAEIQYQKDSYTSTFLDQKRSGFKQLTLGAKYLLYDPFKNDNKKVNIYSWKKTHRFRMRDLLPVLSVYAGANFNVGETPFNYAPSTIEEPSISPKITAIAQNHFGRRWVLVTNMSFDKLGTEFESINYIFTLTRGFNEKWSGFVENQGYMGDYYSDGIFRVGAAFLFDPHMQLDASVGKNIKDTPSLLNVGIGFSWRFADQYENVIIEKEKGSKMDKKVKKKTEKKAKKLRKKVK